LPRYDPPMGEDRTAVPLPEESPEQTSADAPPAVANGSSALPSHIGRFRIIRLLGEGGMGLVYEAEQDNPRRTVALKVIRAGYADKVMLRRFENETQALGRLQHPGIAQIYEAGTAETTFGLQPYFAMELVHGLPLREYCEAQKLNTRQRLELVAKICDAVQHAHGRGLIHRDLKPGNIVVDQEGQPRVLDFGIARLTDSDAPATRQTDLGQIVGTLAYMSPEQALGDPAEIDTRSDVYSIGLILYGLLAGELPYTIGYQLHEAIRTIREEEGTALSSFNRNFRGDIETIVAKALEKDKTRRYASAAELAADIRRYLRDEPIVARPASATYQLQKFARRHRGMVIGVIAVFLALAIGMVASIWQAVRARRAEAAAQAVNDFLQHDVLAQASAFNQSGAGTKADSDLKVRTALDRAAQRIQGKFGKQPQVEASIRSTIGQAYDDLGLYPAARTQLERALELDRSALGPDDAATIDTLTRLARVVREQSKYKDADALSTQALGISRRVLGERADLTLRAMSGLADVYSDEGKSAQAEALYRQTLELRRWVQGADDPLVVQDMVGLGRVLNAEAKYTEAEVILEQVVATRRRVLGAEHPSTLEAMDSLAKVFVDDGKFTQAAATLEQVVEIERRVLGPEHPDTLDTINTLANVEYQQGKLAQAEALYRQNFEIRRRVLGEENTSTLKSQVNLAMVDGDMGNYAEAEGLDREALQTSERLRGRDDYLTSAAMTGLAATYANEGKGAQAEALRLQVLEIRRRVLGPEHRNTLYAMNGLGDTYTGEGKYAEAEATFLQLLEIQKRVLGAEDFNRLRALHDLGFAYLLQGKYAQAQSYFAQALAGRRHTLGPRHPSSLATEDDIALTDVREGKYAEAEPLAREVLELAKKIEPDDFDRWLAASVLGASLAGQKRYEEAEPLLREGYQGMLAMKERSPAVDKYYWKLAHEWLVRVEARGKLGEHGE
jgi:eukaryotic-like serine/threonine-protein kinase